MLTLKSHAANNGAVGSSRQPRQPIESWTSKTVKMGERSRQNGLINSPRGLYGRGKVPITSKQGVGGEWALKECEEHTTWLNGILKKHKSRPISDLRKSISDGLTLVNILEILFNGKIQGVQTRPIIRAQRLENINLCLRFLENRGVEIQHISADELTDSNLRATLALVTCLRKRFEAFHTSNSAHGDGSAASMDKSIRPPTEDSIQPSIGREASIHSFHSQHSVHSQHSDGIPSRPRSSEIPATIPSDDERPSLNVGSPTPVNGDTDLMLPGTMADSDPDEPRPELADKPENVVVPSVTQLDSQGVSQHGVSSRRQQVASSQKKSFRPPPLTKRNSEGIQGSPIMSRSPIRDALTQSVEEKLKNLLDSPNPGGGPHRNLPMDDGELLEPPPPRRRSYHGDDDDDEENEAEVTIEDNKLQAMLEDPDKFEDYHKDWDRYVSDYIPSHSAEKTEGPRAQTLLDRQASQPTPPPSSQQRSLPFFHAPPTQHMGPVQSPPPVANRSPFLNGPHPMSSRDPHSHGSIYNDSGRRNRQYNGMQPYYPGEETPTQRRKLPSYSDHIQRHPPKHRMPNSTNPNNIYIPEGPRPQNSPVWQPQGYPRDLQQPRRRRDQYEPRPNYGPQRDYDQQAVDEDHQRVRQYLNHMHGDSLPNARGIPMEELSRRQDYRHPPSSRKLEPNSPYMYMDHMPLDSRTQQTYLRNGGGLDGSRDFAFSLSDSSSRSSTPPLPPLSPDNSDLESVPNSPYLGKKVQRSISVGVLPSGVHFPPHKLNDSSMGMKRRKNSSNRSGSSSHKMFEPKAALRRSAGKGRRKMAKGVKSSSSSLVGVSSTTSSKRKSPNSRGLPVVPLLKVQEHTEHTDSDLSSHHSDRRSDSDNENDSGSASHLGSLPSKASIKVSETHQQQHSATESVEPPDAENIRQQLVVLENMYKEILQVIGNDRRERLLENPGERLSVSSMSTASAKTQNKPKASSGKASKRRDKDIKMVNKRFARVESHVVTLARSVAHLSSELRSQSAMFHEIEALRHEVSQLRDMHVLNANDVLNGGMKFRPIVPLCSSPQKIKKLTKFFGEEPPLLSMFLRELGYEKFVSLFEKEGIGMVELPYLSEERLENIGVPTGPRLRILQEAQLMV
ncbi:uncharacterized protein LOC110979634 [Acanthaster planci]|uniref:Uncharacterized protein LOC110979634 n=1 Tax=Acanthaster planci TaxID=133434 RepID=A0A8B7YFE9_ACAPL|nr:uncharacterized protein LOC110979634 [Acanthaster planci]XP_022091320.1 uncharacterized protein LOC110979634 [Acanthaster planci]XP_022091321.1 uncharacterized protein LOC110979634 [Acanthaster planci]XP_022091322.1 uncharacterized protein LOC110979634 [Acanthaster planci]XP_022091323.1 uncharacterized protein LOC110979634 [Acanthaster planci]